MSCDLEVTNQIARAVGKTFAAVSNECYLSVWNQFLFSLFKPIVTEWFNVGVSIEQLLQHSYYAILCWAVKVENQTKTYKGE